MYDTVILSLPAESGGGPTVVTVPVIGADELPPPYTPSPTGGIPMINCKVCQSMINIEGKTHQHVVKCNVCNEATVSLACLQGAYQGAHAGLKSP